MGIGLQPSLRAALSGLQAMAWGGIRAWQLGQMGGRLSGAVRGGWPGHALSQPGLAAFIFMSASTEEDWAWGKLRAAFGEGQTWAVMPVQLGPSGVLGRSSASVGQGHVCRGCHGDVAAGGLVMLAVGARAGPQPPSGPLLSALGG